MRASGWASSISYSAGRWKSNEHRPAVPYTSKPNPLGIPNAVRDTENVAANPDANRAVQVAVSSFSTSPISLLTGAAPCPTTAPSGNGRLPIWIDTLPPDTAAIGPHRYSPWSMMCAPISPNAPDPSRP